MWSLPSNLHVYVALGATDLRKSIDGLAAVVQERYGLNPFSASLFVFCNAKKDKLKILYWDHAGFWLYYRRLECGTFAWPDGDANSPLCLSPRELRWLLDGLTLTQQHAHKAVHAEAIV